MKINVRAVLLVIALGVTIGSVIAVAQEARKPIILGGYRAVATDDAEVQAAAEFAVNAEGEKQNTSIKLTSVNQAERQSAAGSNFRLCLTVEVPGEDDEEGVSKTVKVVVHRDLKQEYSLTSWAEADCSE